MNKKSLQFDRQLISDWLLIILSVAAVCFVPCIVQMVPVERTAEEIQVFGRAGYLLGDAFSFIKSKTLLIITALIIIIRFFGAVRVLTTEREPYILEHVKDPVNIFSVLYLVCVVISTVFSPYRATLMFGIFERYEGFLILCSYIIIFLNIRAVFSTRKRIMFFVTFLLLFAAFIAGIGIMQFIGRDPFQTELGQTIILGKYKEQLISFDFNFQGMVYSTLYNPNNTGVYAAVAAVFFGVAALMISYKNILKYLSAILAAAMLIVLLGSHSFSGAFGVAAALIVFFLMAIFYFLWHKRFKEKSGIISVTEKAICVILVAAAAYWAATSVAAVTSRLQYIMADMNSALDSGGHTDNFYYKAIKTDDNKLSFETKDGTFTITGTQDAFILAVTDMNGSEVPPHNEKIVNTVGEQQLRGDESEEELSNNMLLLDSVLYSYYTLSNGVEFVIKTANNLQGERYYTYEYLGQFLFAMQEDKMIVLNKRGNVVDVSTPVPSFGFEDNQLFGSTRGFIWSKTFPMLLDRPVFGNGPDTYAYVFPQRDVIGKANVFGDPYYIVDKPHNFYLMQAVNTGFISLIAILALFCVYVFDTFRTLFKRKVTDSFLHAVSLAAFSAVVCFWVGSINVDSTVSVSPLFWGIFGLGFACNRLIRNLKVSDKGIETKQSEIK